VSSKTIRIEYNRYHPDGTLNEFQQKMFADVTTPILVGDAGVGSGKSYECCQKMIKLSWLNRGVAGGLLCPSYPEYQRDIVPNFEDILEANNVPFLYNQQKKTWQFPWSRKPLYIFTAEKRIKGPNLGWGGVNEYGSIPWERMNEFVNLRIRIPCPNPQVEIVGTPEDEFGWRDEFITKQTSAGRISVVNGKTSDNSYFLRDGFVEEMQATLDPLSFQLWIMGRPVKLNSKAFYYAFLENPEKVLDKKIQRQPKLLVHAVVDFNVGNMHASLWNVISTHQTNEQKRWQGDREPDVPERDEKELHAFGEIVLRDKQADTYAMGAAIQQRFGTKGVLITGDASGSSRKTTGFSDFKVLEDMGFEVRYKSRNAPLRERQNLVNGALYHGKIKINPEACPVLVNDLYKVEQDPRSFEKVKANPNLTHASDTLDYLTDFEFELGLKGRDKFKTESIHGLFKRERK